MYCNVQYECMYVRTYVRMYCVFMIIHVCSFDKHIMHMYTHNRILLQK